MSLYSAEGIGTTLGSKYYTRNFYVSNRDAAVSSKRSSLENSSLSLADSMALRRAARQLGDFDYSEENATNIKNSVLAYIDTYNNTLSSLSDSSDKKLERYGNQLKNLTNQYKNELDKIGITIKEDGTLENRESLFKTADIEKFKSLFSSNSDYMQRSAAYSKRIQTRSEALVQEEQIAKQLASKKAPAASPISDQTAAAAAMSQTADLDTLLNTGVGANVNIVL